MGPPLPDRRAVSPSCAARLSSAGTFVKHSCSVRSAMFAPCTKVYLQSIGYNAPITSSLTAHRDAVCESCCCSGSCCPGRNAHLRDCVLQAQECVPLEQHGIQGFQLLLLVC